MSAKKFIIFAPSYRATNGGGVVLHRLCALLNDLGYEAYLTRFYNGVPVYSNNFLHPLSRLVGRSLWNVFTPFRVHPGWDTPLIKNPKIPLGDEWIAVYPEIVFGNPLRAKSVVRWLLHKPGFHDGYFMFGNSEYHIDFNSFAQDFFYPGCKKADFSLNVVNFPYDKFNKVGALPKELRKGTAYCLRKGRGKRIVHDLRDSVFIDGMSHDRVASIFKRVKTFISYDPYTAYSSFAVLCGAESVVIPDPGVDKASWFPNSEDRLGVAYGFEDIAWARATASGVLGRMQAQEIATVSNVKRFAEDVLQYFSR